MQFSVLPGNSNSLLTLMGTQAVQGGGGTTVATYTDPAVPPEATIDQLLPTVPRGPDGVCGARPGRRGLHVR